MCYSLPHKYWDEIFASVIYLINGVPATTSSILYTTLFNKAPDYSPLWVLGCLCCPLTKPYNDHKLQLKSLPFFFLGYTPAQKGYKCLRLPTNKIYISRRVKFDETAFPSLSCSGALLMLHWILLFWAWHFPLHSPQYQSRWPLLGPLSIQVHFPLHSPQHSLHLALPNLHLLLPHLFLLCPKHLPHFNRSLPTLLAHTSLFPPPPPPSRPMATRTRDNTGKPKIRIMLPI